MGEYFFFFFFFLAVSLLSCVEVEARNDGPIDQPEAFADVVKKYYPLRSFRLLAAADSGISLSSFAPSANANAAEGLRIRTASIATSKGKRRKKRKKAE